MGHARLQRSEDVRAVLRRGRRCARPSVVVHGLTRSDAGGGRLAVVASKRVGGAVERNRAKRVLRAAAAAVEIPANVDVALVARPSTPRQRSTDVTVEVARCIEHLFASAGSTPSVSDGAP